jgi:tripartite-type tricarboxylate transporter receptor subunit TctC
MTRNIRLIGATITLALVVIGVTAGVVRAAEPPYPTRPIRLIVPFPPVGGTDLVARLIARKLTDAMGQALVVENRSGAAGNIGAEMVARADPNGYTLMMALSTQLTVNPSLYRLSFDVEKDLQPITTVVSAEHILVVHPSVRATTLEELIALAKQKPGTLNYASGGVGTSIHMAAELLKKRAGIDIVNVSYKGAGPAVAAVTAGECDVLTGTVASTIALVKAGRLRALAVTSARRTKVLPELPTVAESGYPGFEADAWYGLFAPVGTSNSIVARIGKEVREALQQADVQTTLASQGLDPVTSTPAELAARIKKETAIWAGIIKDAGIRTE